MSSPPASSSSPSSPAPHRPSTPSNMSSASLLSSAPASPSVGHTPPMAIPASARESSSTSSASSSTTPPSLGAASSASSSGAGGSGVLLTTAVPAPVSAALAAAAADSVAPLEACLVESAALDDFKCGICLGLLKKPHQCRQGHLFCLRCIEQALALKPLCPHCRDPLTRAELARVLYVENKLAALRVHCPYHFVWDAVRSEWRPDLVHGCPHVTALERLDEHVRHCDYVPRACPYSRACGVVRARTLEAHKRSECRFRPVPCVHCALDVQAAKMDEHVAKCPAVRVACAQCQELRPRGTLAAHLAKECPLGEVKCAFGCATPMLRRDLAAHNESKVVEHLEYVRHVQATQLSALREELRETQLRFQEELEQLRRMPRIDRKLTWTIDSWSRVVAHNAFARSKAFMLEGQQWYMGLYPNGDDEAHRGFVSIFLFQDEPTRLEGRLHIDFTIRILNRDARRSLVKALKGNFPVLGGQGWGECKFVRCETLNDANGFVKDDRLQIDIDLAVRSARAQI